jgi:hypothetical protein
MDTIDPPLAGCALHPKCHIANMFIFKKENILVTVRIIFVKWSSMQIDNILWMEML